MNTPLKFFIILDQIFQQFTETKYRITANSDNRITANGFIRITADSDY
jgi:hypothetical protein